MKPVRTLFFLSPLLLPATAWSEAAKPDQLSRWLSLGAGVTENANGRFGQYSQALQGDRLFGLGALGYEWRDGEDPYRSASLKAQLDLHQIALESRYARQGSYRIIFDYRQFEAISRERFTTVYPNRGSVQTLPAGYSDVVGAQRFGDDAGVRRQQGELDLMRRLGNWRISATLASEEKTGSRITGASERFGDATLLAAPVDQRHDTLDLRAGYEASQWSITTVWHHSRLSNDARALSYANPINLGAPLRTLDLGPDNEFSRVSVDGVYRLAANRQLSWFASLGDGRQDDRFLQPVLVADQPLLGALDARRVDTDLRLGYRHQVSARFGYRLQGDYRDRDNRSDVIQLSPTGYSHLYDNRRERWSADVHYRMERGMRMRGGVEWTSIERTSRSLTRFTDKVDSARLWSELRLPSLGAMSWSLRVEGIDRDNSLSAARRAALDVAMPSQALPDYLLSGRTWLYQLQADLPLTETVMAAASYRRLVDNFDNRYYGLRGRDSDELSINLSWQVSAAVAVSSWGQYQEHRLSQRGLEFNPAAAPSHANAPWRQRIRDTSVGAGVNVRWQINPALDATVAFTHSDNDSSYRSRWLADADTGESVGTGNSLPGYGVDVQRLDATLNWDYSARTRFKLRYLYEHFRSSDWAWGDDQFNALAFGWNSSRYDAHALLVSLRHQFSE